MLYVNHIEIYSQEYMWYRWNNRISNPFLKELCEEFKKMGSQMYASI